MGDDAFWDKLAEQEAEAEQISKKDFNFLEESGDEFLPAYPQNEDYVNDPETKEWDYGAESSDEDGEFNEFVDKDPYEFGISYAQLGQISQGDPELGTTLGGKFFKIEKMVQAQTVSKEKLYLNKLKAELNDVFGSSKKVNHYATVVQQVPRYWLKNGRTIAATYYLIDRLSNSPLTSGKLASFSTEFGVDKEDLFRYYRLLKEYT
jgi:hypothetical protein